MLDINIDTTEIYEAISAMGTAEVWIPQIIDRLMPPLGATVSRIMKEQVRPRSYTGTLEASIGSEYNSATKAVTIGPTAKRGQLDAGRILQEGTNPIPSAPWKPIQKWAASKGIASREAFFILRKIRNEGISAHPFLEETMVRGDFRDAVEATAQAIGAEISVQAVSGGKKI